MFTSVFLLTIVYFSVCLTSNKLYWIEDQLTNISTQFYMSASWRRWVDCNSDELTVSIEHLRAQRECDIERRADNQRCSSGGRMKRRLNWFVTFGLTVVWLCEAPGAPPHGGLKMCKMWDVMEKKSTWKMKNLVIFYGFDSALFYPLLVGENSNIMIDMCWQKMGPQFLTHSMFTHIYVKFAQMLCI